MAGPRRRGCGPDPEVPMLGEAVILVIVLAGLAFVLVMIMRGW